MATMLQLAPPSHPPKDTSHIKNFPWLKCWKCLWKEIVSVWSSLQLLDPSQGETSTLADLIKGLFPWERGWTLAQSFSWNYTASYLHKFCDVASTIVRKYIKSWSKTWHYLQHCLTNIFSTYFIFKFFSLLQFSRKTVYDKSLGVRNVHHGNSQ